MIGKVEYRSVDWMMHVIAQVVPGQPEFVAHQHTIRHSDQVLQGLGLLVALLLTLPLHKTVLTQVVLGTPPQSVTYTHHFPHFEA